MKISLNELKFIIREEMMTGVCEAKNYDDLWKETSDGAFQPKLAKFPRFAYHGTPAENAESMLQGFQTDGIDFTFDKQIAMHYGSFKANGNRVAIIQLEVRKLQPYQWAGDDNERDGIALNGDVGSMGFTFFGTVPAEALTVVTTGKK